MKKFTAFLTAFVFATQCVTPALAALTEPDRAPLYGRNFLVNPGAESGLAAVTASTSAHLATTTSAANIDEGNAAFQWSPTAANETLTFGFYNITSGSGLSAQPGLVSCRFKSANGVNTHTLQGWDGSTKWGATSVVGFSAKFQRTSSQVFTLPTSGNITLQLTSGAADTLYIDKCYLGLAEGFNLSAAVVNTTPTVTKLTSGTSQTYTTPFGATYLIVRMVGGGGGGGGSGTSAVTGTTGTASTFGTLTANGGNPGTNNGGTSATGTIGSGWVGSPIPSNSGGAGGNSTGAGTYPIGGVGGGSGIFGGAGPAGATNAPGSAAPANTGGGGGGAGSPTQGHIGGGGGSGGGGVVAVTSGAPLSTYTYTVGGGGAAGVGSDATGGAAGSGYIEVTEYYGNTAVTLYRPDNGGLAAGDLVETFATTCPTGTIAADGSAVSRTNYSTLFAAIGTTYGVGDGSTTFNVPNGQGVFIRGAGSQTISSIAYSGTQGTTQGDQMQGHNHTSIQIDAASGASGAALHSVAIASSDGGASNFTGTIGNPTSDGSNGTPRTGSETRPANIVAKRCVRTLPASPAPLLVSPEVVSATHNAFSTGGGSTALTWYIPESTWGVTLTPGMWDIQMDGNADTAITGTYGVQVMAGLSDGTSHLAYSMCGMALSGSSPSTQEVGCHVHVTYTATSTVTVKPELRFLGFTGSGSVTLNWRDNLDTQPTGSLVARRIK